MSIGDYLARLANMSEEIGRDLDTHGGVLRCETCLTMHVLEPGDTGHYTAHGWPKCCGSSMRWWTQRQIDAREMPS